MAKDKDKDQPLGDDGRDDSGSISDRAANGEQQEMFPSGVLDGDKRTLANMIRRGLAVELAAEMTNAHVPLRDGMLDPDKLYRFAVTVRPAKVETAPHREKDASGDERVASWKILQKLKPVHLESLGMGADAVTVSFERLLAANAQEAGVLLDGLRERFTEYMRSGEVDAA